MFLDKLKALRNATKNWEQEKKIQLRSELREIDQELDTISGTMSTHTLNPNSQSRILSLEKRKSQIFLIKEMTWKLKSRVTWLKEGD